ncbi:hypothetical protein ACFFKE_17820 [Streptomyces mutabilis]|uniref:hypothetical protein n=1 Tax=Streptomyces mutabilis TaxID=67332 RepID=UPI001784B7C8|nr:hypothetical protein [Streptomyces mutabilis]
MAAAAQRLAHTCWAERTSATAASSPPGVPPPARAGGGRPLPTLSDLAGTVTADSLPGLHRMLYEVVP